MEELILEEKALPKNQLEKLHQYKQKLKRVQEKSKVE
jgi:hypothetical protein